MRVLLIGDDTQCVDLPHDGHDLSAGWEAALTPSRLATVRLCVFDRREGVEFEDLEAGLRPFDAADAVLLPYSGGAWLDIVRGLPARLLSLIPNLSSAGALAIPARRLSDVLPFQDADPLQDALIRLVREDSEARIRFSDSVTGTDNSAEWLPDLVPGMGPRATPGMQRHLSGFAPEELAPVESAADAVALSAGLFQLHDCLDRSHSLSQDVQGQGRHAAGDYWHAIMHRREPDYGNSKYWYRHVGRHPIFDDLAHLVAGEFESADDTEAREWAERVCGGGEWDPFAWVDFCEHAARRKNTALHDVARRIQWIEMLLLLRQTAEDAYGPA